MKIRKTQYDLEFNHILTFQEEYKNIIAPLFKEPNLRYSFENVGTDNESIKLMFTDLHFILHCSKSAIRMMYEGDPKDFVRGGSPQWDFFHSTLDSFKELSGFGNILRHSIQVQAVYLFGDFKEPCELDEEGIGSSKYLKLSPFNKYNEFAVKYDYIEGENNSEVIFGNFNELDISKSELSPFETEFNKDLYKSNGYLADVKVKKPISSLSKSNYKDLLSDAEALIQKFKLNEEN